MGQGTAMPETIIGRLLTADGPISTWRPCASATDGAYDAEYSEGLRDPETVLNAIRG